MIHTVRQAGTVFALALLKLEYRSVSRYMFCGESFPILIEPTTVNQKYRMIVQRTTLEFVLTHTLATLSLPRPLYYHSTSV